MAKKFDETAIPDPPPDSIALPDHLARIQAMHTESEPKVVPLVRQPQGGPDAPPYAPTAKPMPCPRAIHQNERAPNGLKRFRIVCQEPPAPFRYILAPSENAAVAHYLKSTGLTAVLESLPEAMRPTPRLEVRALPD